MLFLVSSRHLGKVTSVWTSFFLPVITWSYKRTKQMWTVLRIWILQLGSPLQERCLFPLRLGLDQMQWQRGRERVRRQAKMHHSKMIGLFQELPRTFSNQFTCCIVVHKHPLIFSSRQQGVLTLLLVSPLLSSQPWFCRHLPLREALSP